MAYSEKQKEYTMKYLEKLKEIRFRVRPEEYQKYEEAAEKAGYPSMRQFYFNMTFGECMEEFGFNREVEWNKPPLNGQKITTYFRKHK